MVQRLPGFRAIAVGCGTASLPEASASGGSRELRHFPPHCLGHIGYAVVPWKQGNGYAKRALELLLPEAAAEGLPFVEITTDPANIASQRAILANGGILVEHFTKPPQFGNKPGLRYRIALP